MADRDDELDKLLPQLAKYPVVRVHATLQEWKRETEGILARAALAGSLKLVGEDIDELVSAGRHAEVAKLEKVYGLLIDRKGPLSEQQTVRSDVIKIVEASPRLQLHGARVFAWLVVGHLLRKQPKEVSYAIQVRLNDLLRYKIGTNNTATQVRGCSM